MHPNHQLIDRFYAAFADRDGAGMAACYHPEIVFSDPVFPRLAGEMAGRMWKMLTSSGRDLEITHGGVEADDETGRADWVARYSFSGTGRKVVNRVEARFRFRDGLIIDHRDHFGFWRWSAQALGPSGLLLGWSPSIRRAVQGRAAARLTEFKG